jgi:hypothetical protein
MTDMLICNVTEEQRKIVINFFTDKEIHVDTVVGFRYLPTMDKMYFKVKTVSTNDTVWSSVIAEEYGHKTKAGKIDIREFMKGVYVFEVTDKNTLDELSKQSRWL